MAGFFGLFGKKKDEPKDAFFLNPDESKTFGDIDYMRTSKTVRRTFVKTVGNPDGGEVIKQISSDKMLNRDPREAKRITPKTISNGFSNSFNSSFNSTPAETPSPKPAAEKVQESSPAPAPAPKAAPKTQASSMDIFRNMAKDIRK